MSGCAVSNRRVRCAPSPADLLLAMPQDDGAFPRAEVEQRDVNV
jgi:hypothetical protein